MHQASMGATDRQRNWLKLRTTLGKPGFYQRRGQGPNSLGVFAVFLKSWLAKSPARREKLIAVGLVEPRARQLEPNFTDVDIS